MQCSKVHESTAQYCTSTVQYRTVQYSTNSTSTSIYAAQYIMPKGKSDGKVNFISDMGEVTIGSENFLTQRKASET